MKRSTIALALAIAVLTACNNGKSSSGASPGASSEATSAVEASATPNCNGQSPVWALEGPKVYLLPGDRRYGKTKHGQYLCLSQAQAEGYRHARGAHRRRHHQKGVFQQ